MDIRKIVKEEKAELLRKLKEKKKQSPSGGRKPTKR
jgi:hypothetical protein